MNEEVMARIKKLLALSESSNENESKTAMLQVQRLMAKHRLTMKEVKEANKEPINIITQETEVTYTRARWKYLLSNVIAENFGCYSYVVVYYTNRITFFGKDEDVTVCKIMLEYALNCIDCEVDKYKKQYKRERKSTRGLENTYALGFIKGLQNAFEKQKADNEEWGLVLVREQEVVDAFNDIKFDNKPSKDVKPMDVAQDRDMYNRAIKDGERFSVSDRIANEGDDCELVGIE